LIILFGSTYFPGSLKFTFNLAFYIWLVAELTVLAVTSVRGRKGSGEKTGSDRGSVALLLAGGFLAVIVNPFLILHFRFVLPLPLFWLGIAFMALGLFLRVYSVWILGNSFTPTVQVASGQKIVQAGPYRCIRHPAYAGTMLGIFGISVAFRSPPAILAALLILAAAYGYRIKIEEKVLEESFGPEYKEYEAHTWRLVPHIW
jgi:protein-S-isoprenylcysteine O-methyltransferase Ste14